MRKYFILIIFVILVLVSGCIEQESPNSTEAECVIPSDCEGRLHIQCVGYWQCIDGKCNWQCSGEHLELPREAGEGMTG